ncbi:hypothetical protein IWZ00DRAFT_508974 [Phyllosticta capitalensis]
MLSLSYNAARILAPLSIIYNVSAQIYGLLSVPNMKDVNDANMSVFTPSAGLVALFFFPMQVAMVVWAVRFWKVRGNGGGMGREGLGRDGEDMLGYAGVLVLGNACIGSWMFFWNASHLGLSNIFVLINLLAHISYLSTSLPPLRRASAPSLLTHIVAKTYTGISILDILHNTSAAYFVGVAAPVGFVKVLTGVFFAVAGALSDWILGACLVYDLAAFSVGQRARTDADPAASKAWSALLGAYMLGTAAVVVVKNLIRPPYAEDRGEYTRIQEVDENQG